MNIGMDMDIDLNENKNANSNTCKYTYKDENIDMYNDANINGSTDTNKKENKDLNEYMNVCIDVNKKANKESNTDSNINPNINDNINRNKYMNTYTDPILKELEHILDTYTYQPKIKKNEIYDMDKINFIFEIFNLILNIDYIKISKSKIHGNGIFATKNIKKGQFITIYPVYYIFIHDKYGNRYLIESPIVKQKNLTYNHETIKYYSFYFDEKSFISSDPRIIDDMLFVGHIMNDGIKCKSTNENIIRNEKKVYDKISIHKNNCEYKIIKNMIIVIVATKDIEMGEELFVKYGFEYWKQINSYE